MSIKIAIDGPSGAGKTTLAKALSKELGFTYIDTGAMYRTIGLYMLDNGIDVDNEEEVAKNVDDVDIRIDYDENGQQMYLNGVDVSGRIRTPEVSHAASVTSAYGKVREKLVDMQREMASKINVVMDGRDIGTNVLKDADIKIFMVADTSVRATRRRDELKEKGIEKTHEEIEEDIKTRDHRDSNRENNPLMQAEDAYLLDSTKMSVEEEIEFVRRLYEKIIKEGK